MEVTFNNDRSKLKCIRLVHVQILPLMNFSLLTNSQIGLKKNSQSHDYIFDQGTD